MVSGQYDKLSTQSYLQQVNYQWINKSSQALADLFSLRNEHVQNKNLYLDNPDEIVANYVDEPFNEILSAHLRCLYLLWNKDYIAAHLEHNNVVQGLLKIFPLFKEENWLLPLIMTVCLDLRLLATKLDKMPADKISKSSKGTIKPREPLEKAAEVLMACFRICTSDNRASESDTKKWGMMPLVNQLFKLYFTINKLHLMKPLVRAIDSSPLKDKFPLSQQITYKYYVGRKAMYDGDYNLANEYLSFAFERCHKKSKKNKRQILIYLVPVKMLLGYLPSKRLLEKYDLMELWDVREAVLEGNIKQLCEVTDKNQEFFVKCGIYLMLELLKPVTYRNLFKAVYKVVNTPIISLDQFLIALRMMDNDDVDIEETSCILANLIYQGKVKGYISHSHQKVVLSKVDPFPKLSTISG